MLSPEMSAAVASIACIAGLYFSVPYAANARYSCGCRITALGLAAFCLALIFLIGQALLWSPLPP